MKVLRLSNSVGRVLVGPFEGEGVTVVLANVAHNLAVQILFGGKVDDWSGAGYEMTLKEVLAVLASRGRLLRTITRKLNEQLMAAIGSVLDTTLLSASSAEISRDLIEENWQSDGWIMVHYLRFAIERIEEWERLEADFYDEHFDEIIAHFFSPPQP